MNQDRLAVGEPAAIEKVGPDGEERLGNRGRLTRPEPSGSGSACGSGTTQYSRVPAARDERAHVVALAPARDIRADGRDSSGDLEAGQVRDAGRWRILAEPLQDVGPIDACGLDSHQQFTGPGRRCRSIDQTQDFRAAGG